MKKLWEFLQEPKNLAVLAMLGSVFTFVWQELVALKPTPAPTTPPAASSIAPPSPPVSVPPTVSHSHQTATANGTNGVAVNVNDGTININHGAAPEKAKSK